MTDKEKFFNVKNEQLSINQGHVQEKNDVFEHLKNQQKDIFCSKGNNIQRILLKFYDATTIVYTNTRTKYELSNNSYVRDMIHFSHFVISVSKESLSS